MTLKLTKKGVLQLKKLIIVYGILYRNGMDTKEVYVSKFISSDTQFNYCTNFLSVRKLKRTAEIVLNITPSKK